MRIDLYIHNDSEDLLKQILHNTKQIIMTQAELAQALRDASAEADKAKAEILQISDLETAIANAGNTTPEVDDALAALKTAVQGVDDDIVPYSPPPVG